MVQPVPKEQTPEIAARAKRIVETLSIEFPSRAGMFGKNLERAAKFIENEFQSLGFDVIEQPYRVHSEETKNLIVEKPGFNNSNPQLILGAHYDTVPGTPGADDNASGIAGLLELARLLKDYPNRRPMQFVAFTLEEPPYFFTSQMGSREFAKSLKRAGTEVEAMICLEMLGYGGSHLKQKYPFPFMQQIGGYPKHGDFIGVVGNVHSRHSVRIVRTAMRHGCSIGVESLSAPGFLWPLNLSDHSSFWRYGYRAMMITDTAFLRNPNYHTPEDIADTLNYNFLAEVIRGVYYAVVVLDALK